jgi:hypothetical protein
MLTEFVSGLLLISLAVNCLLGWHLWKRRSRTETYDAQALMTDLLHGQALVRVERVAPADVLLRSPRGRV